MQELLRNFLLSYIRFWAQKALSKHRPQVVGVGGSVGKSSTCQAIYAVLKDSYHTQLIKGNSETGVPLGLLGLELTSLGYTTPLKSIFNWLGILFRAPFSLDFIKQSKYLIVEMGIDDPNPPKNMEYLLTIVRPNIALSLNIAPPHLGQFEILLKGKQVENKLDFLLDRMADEDTKIISKSNCEAGIYNADDLRIKKLMTEFAEKRTKTRLLSFGKEKTNNVSFLNYSVSTKSTAFTFSIKIGGESQDLEITLKNYVLPIEYREVLAAAILIGLEVKLSPDTIKSSLEKNFRLPKGRASIFQGINNSTIIDSSYNASPLAVLAFLGLLSKLKEQTKRPAVMLFGDMRELGNEAQGEHERVAKEIAKQVDYLYCVGPLTREYVIQEVEHHNKNLKEIRWFDSAKRAGEYLKEHLPKDSILLVKGSQNTIFLEEAVKQLLKNESDISKLCRQEEYWLKKKQSTI